MHVWGDQLVRDSEAPSATYKDPVRAATAAALPACTFSVAAGTLTGNVVGALAAIDGVTMLEDERVLVKDQGGGTHASNGIYDVTVVGDAGTAFVLTRSLDANTNGDIRSGNIVPVLEGTVNDNQLFILTTNDPIDINVTALTWINWGAVMPLVTAATRGEVNDLGAANTVLTTDGATAGGAWATIVDANVNAAAAIAGTKIAPDFGAQDVTTTGDYHFGMAATAPVVSHDTETTAAVAGDDLTIGAQGVSNATPANAMRAGNLGLRGGIATGDASNLDGNIWFHVVCADWKSMEKGLWLADAMTAPTATQAGGSFLWSASGVLNSNSALALTAVAGEPVAATGSLRLSKSGSITCRNDDNDRDLVMLKYFEQGGAEDVVELGNNTGKNAGTLIRSLSNIWLYINTTARFQVTGSQTTIFIGAAAASLATNGSSLYFSAATAAPVLKQDDSTTTNDTADDLTVAAQSINTTGAGTGYGGDLGLRGGIATSAGGATNKHGNVWFHVAPASWQTMEKGVFVADAVTAPTGNPATGAFVYSAAGSLTLHGSGGAKVAVGATTVITNDVTVTGSVTPAAFSESVVVAMQMFT